MGNGHGLVWGHLRVVGNRIEKEFLRLYKNTISFSAIAEARRNLSKIFENPINGIKESTK